MPHPGKLAAFCRAGWIEARRPRPPRITDVVNIRWPAPQGARSRICGEVLRLEIGPADIPDDP